MASPRGLSADTRLKVFISHARADVGFADQLGAFLHEAGFNPIIDRFETGGDGWQVRLGRIIEDADALVMVLTTASANSDICAWQLEQAQSDGKRVVFVLPAALNGVARELAGPHSIYFYTDPNVPNSGFFDGQRRLLSVLRDIEGTRVHPDDLRRAADEEVREARRAQARAIKEERRMRKAEQRELAREIARVSGGRGGPRFPAARVTFLGLVAAGVVGVIINPGLLTQARSAWANISATASSLTAEPEPYSPMNVAAEDYHPERDLVAVRAGANVRDYPYTTGELIFEAPGGTRMEVTGRLMVQGKWWYRVVLEDERVGFVREDVVRWAAPQRAQQQQASQQTTTEVAAIEPAIAVTAGRAGANLRTGPGRNARALVRLPAGSEMSATGKVRQGGHWWVRVALEDGRSGFVRDDVLTTESRASLDL